MASISKARPPIGTDTPRALSSRRERSSTNKPDSWVRIPLGADTRAPLFQDFSYYFRNALGPQPFTELNYKP